MKKLLNVILVVVIICNTFAEFHITSNALSSNGQCGENVYYTFDSSTGLLTISGSGDMTGYSSTTSPFYKQKSIKHLIIDSGIISIGEYTFQDCGNLTNVTISDSVTNICDGAFYGCSGLKELTIPCSSKIYSSQYTFYNCTNIEKVTLTKGTGTMQNYYSSTYANYTCYAFTPWYISSNIFKELVIKDGVNNIGDYAFYKCTYLTCVKIPNSVKSIGDDAFGLCPMLKELTMPVSTKIGMYSFSPNRIEKLTLTKGTGNMQNYYENSHAFWSTKNIKEILIEDGIINIGNYGFSDCINLRYLTIGNSVTSIGNYAFSNCNKLTSITIPDSVTSIRENAFWLCSNLNEVYYLGSEAHWKQITVESENNELLNANIHYNHIHKFENWKVTATCTQSGKKTGFCICGLTYEETIPALGHNASTKVKVKPTNTQIGYTEYSCSRCGRIQNVDSFTAPTGKVSGFKCASRTATAEKFTWTKTSGVNGYQVQLLNSAGKNAGTVTTTGNAYTFAKLAAGHAYKARVRFYIKAADGKNYYSAWATINSPTLPAGTSLVKVTVAKKAFTAQWKKGACTGYQLQYSTNNKFSGAKTITIKKVGTLKYTVSKLTAKKTFYVRVRTYKTMAGANYFSTWSTTKSVKTK